MRLAKSEDLKTVMELYDACRVYLNSRGIDQWAHGYPKEDIVKRDIECQDLWLYQVEESIAAVLVLNQSAAEKYSDLAWECSHQKHLEIHRLAVHPKHMNQGLGKRMMNWAESEAKDREACCIRLDTYSLNKDNVRYYKNLGYCATGNEVMWPPVKSPFLCFEKQL